MKKPNRNECRDCGKRISKETVCEDAFGGDFALCYVCSDLSFAEAKAIAETERYY